MGWNHQLDMHPSCIYMILIDIGYSLLFQWSLIFMNCMAWVVPLPSNSHHQDSYIFSRESRTKPSFATVTGRGDNSMYGCLSYTLSMLCSPLPSGWHIIVTSSSSFNAWSRFFLFKKCNSGIPQTNTLHMVSCKNTNNMVSVHVHEIHIPAHIEVKQIW